MAHRFDPSILREYDIRGPVGPKLNAGDAHALGRSFGTTVRHAGGRRVAVGYDGRLTSPALETALVEGLCASGVDVVRTGLGPTPMLYFAEATLEVDAGIQVTGSHNPSGDNGFKMVLAHDSVHGEAIQALARVAAAGDWLTGAGTVADFAVIDAYVERLAAAHPPSAYRIGWDAGNGAAGPVIERLVARLPGEHHLLYTDVDGRFPNHHPDPTIEANLADLRALVADKGLDMGFAFDGDGDRLGAVDGEGRILWGDQLLALLAGPVLARHPGAPIVGDVKASRALFERIAALGGRPVMAKSGHSLIRARMKADGAPLAGELSGHLFFGGDWYGFDDAQYAAVQLIAAVAAAGTSLEALRDGLPAYVNTPELRFSVEAARRGAVVDEVRGRLAAAGAEVNTTDGVRVETPDGWWLLRASNTQDVLVARAEATDDAALARLVAAIDTQLAQSGVTRE